VEPYELTGDGLDVDLEAFKDAMREIDPHLGDVFAEQVHLLRDARDDDERKRARVAFSGAVKPQLDLLAEGSI